MSGGRHSERMGRTFEGMVTVNIDWDTTPVLFKIPTARSTRGRHTRRTWLDYVGCLQGGRMLTFDAKWVGEARDVRRSVLKAHQRAWADQALEAGALTFVLVGAVVGGDVSSYVVPWALLRAEVNLELDERFAAPVWPAGVLRMLEQEVTV